VGHPALAQNASLKSPNVTVTILGVSYTILHILSLRLSKNIKSNMYRIIILPVVFYECETWSLTLREERWLRMSETQVLRQNIQPFNSQIVQYVMNFT
jgi:hypothetical protein